MPETTAPKAQEIGPQRRRSLETGRPLHCCCICGALGTWNANWSCFASALEIDEWLPIAKFCNDICLKAAGPKCENVTKKMKDAAKSAEYRDPEPYKPAQKSPNYMSAVSNQKRDQERQARLAQWRAEQEAPNAQP